MEVLLYGIQVSNTNRHSLISCTSASQESVVFLSSVFSLLLPLVRIHYFSLRQTSTCLCQCVAGQKTPLLVLSPPSYLNTHVLENKLSINPHTQREFCPEGGEGRKKEAGGGGEGKKKTERKRMREEIAVWAEIRLLHFLGRKWIRSGRVAACSSH